jgi:hypothetical protein
LTVSYESQLLLALAQPAKDVADDAASLADAKAVLVVNEDRERCSILADPYVPRPHGLARDGLAGPLRLYLRAAIPLAQRTCKAADGLQYEGDELTTMRAWIVLKLRQTTTQAVLVETVEIGRVGGDERRETRRIEQEAAVPQVAPPVETVVGDR